MHKIIIYMKIRTVLKNKVVFYMSSRYVTYGMQFIISFIIAAKLGPYYLGVYGFLLLILQYFSQINFGIPHSLNVLIVHNKDDRYQSDKYLANCVWIYFYLSAMIAVLYAILQIFNFEFKGDNYIAKYGLILIIIALLAYFNSLFMMVMRARNKVYALSVVQSMSVIANMSVVFLVTGEALIYALMLSLALGGIVSVIIAIFSGVMPIRNKSYFSVHTQKIILHKGLYLFIYNSCFYFILISIRSLVSANYSIEEFGIFTFSFTIANAVMMLLDSVSTLIYPKIIHLLSSDDVNVVNDTINKLRVAYISSSHFLIYLALTLYPFFVYLMPKYQGGLMAMNLISLAILMNTNSFGWGTLLIAKNKERISSIISLMSLVINILIGLLLVYVFHVEFSYVVLATLITYLVYSFISVLYGKKIISHDQVSIKEVLVTFFPIRLLIPYMSALLISILSIEKLIIAPLVIYLLLNYMDVKNIANIARNIIVKPNVTDI